MAGKTKWMQGAAEAIKRHHTKGAFTRWCKSQGFSGVTDECIAKGLASKNPTTVRRANLAKQFRRAKK